MKKRKIHFVVTIDELLQFIGFFVLALFFYLYGTGNALYSKVFLIAVAISICILCRDSGFLYRYKKYYYWQFAFILFVLFSAIYTINTEHWSEQFIVQLKILLKVTTVAIICKDFNGIKKLLAILSALGIALFATLSLTGRLYEAFRLGTEFLGNANSFGHLVSIFMIGAMFYSISAKKTIFRITNIFIVIIDIYMIFLSGGRKFILFAIVFYYTFLIVRPGNTKARTIRYVFASLFMIVIIYIGYYMIMNIDVLYQAIGIRLVGLGTEQGALGVDSQAKLMERGIGIFLEHPIFGLGVGGYQQYSFLYYGKYFYSHSNYIELMANFGLCGMTLYYSRYVKNFFKLWAKRHNFDEEGRLYFSLIISIAVLDIFSISYNQTAFVPLFIMLISGYVDNIRNDICDRGGK